MKHPEKKEAKRYDSTCRCAEFTDTVYSGKNRTRAELSEKLRAAQQSFLPPPHMLKAFTGELHGHTTLSDGCVDIDTYFTNLRDKARLDFAAITDHDHGGVGGDELWNGKWEIIKKKVKEYRRDGEFVTILAYERDSYPYYSNMVLYFENDDGEPIRGVRDGEITCDELKRMLTRTDVVAACHDTYRLSCYVDFQTLDDTLFLPYIEVISRGDAAEYMGNPAWRERDCCEGGFWRDALDRGAKIGVIGGSDDHVGMGGRVDRRLGYPAMYPGVTGVWAVENTHKAIFEALKAKRTYAYMLGNYDGEMHGRIEIEFRINGYWMGSELKLGDNEELIIYFKVGSDVPIKEVTLVKNCRDRIKWYGKNEDTVLDYKQERETDSYYLRVELEDGRFGWTSPIWTERERKSKINECVSAF